jgi:hypothetical protein
LIGALPIVVAISVYMLVFVALGEEVGWPATPFPRCKHATAPSWQA